VAANKLLDLLYQAGFRGRGLDIAYAVAMAESSGNARAHNPNAGTGDNSYGLFQINMLGSMGPARRKQFGLSSNDDLFDPLTNAKVAFRMSNGGKNWGPWSTYNSGAYQQYMGKSQTAGISHNSSGSGTVNDSSGGTATAAPMTRGETAESYGFVQSMFDAIPELKKKFDQAVKGQWSPEKFQAAIRDTNWWKTHSQQERDYLTKQYGDPATAKQEFHTAYTHIQQMAGQLGIQVNDQNKKFLNAMAYNLAARGWSDDQLRMEMGKHVYFDGDNWNGQGGEEQQKLHDYAYSMGVTMSGTWYANSSRDIIRGKATEQTFQSQIRKQAKALFPNWSKQIDAGQSVADLANPYLTTMSQILELPGGSINLFDPTVKKALQYKDPTTGQSTVKPLWQFENELRGDPRWKKTQNAQDSLMQVAHQVLSDFGLKY